MISAQSAPFRLDASCCPFPSAQRLESLFGEVFWGFISSPCILISYLLTEIVSSSRNQLSHMRLPLFCRLVRGLTSFSPVIFVSRRWRRVRRGSPSSRGPRPLETFAHGPVSSGPIRRCSVCQAWRYFPIFLAMGFRPWEIRDFTWVVAWEMEMARRRPKR